MRSEHPVSEDVIERNASIRLLGEAECRTEDGTVTRITDARVATLLAMVALEGGIPRTRAADLFWPQSGSTARTNLRVLLHRIQKTFDLKLFTSGDVIELSPHITVDLHAPDSRWVQGCLESGPLGLRLLSSLELPEGLTEAGAWLAAARGQVEQRLTRSLIAWFERAGEAGDLSQAMALAEVLIGLNPLSEVGYQELMKALVAKGDRSAALAVFERCRKELHEQLGTHPSRTTVELHRQILRSRAEGQTDAAAARLVQREAEIEQITSAISRRRIVIVEGPSGMGKSALLRHVANERGDIYWRITEHDSARPFATFHRAAVHLIERARARPDHNPDDLAVAERFLERLGPSAARDSRDSRDNLTPGSTRSLVQSAIDIIQLTKPGRNFAIMVDDLHLCDDESLEVLSTMITDSGELMPWCDFVLAYRPMRARRRVRALCEKLAASGRLKLVQPAALTAASVHRMLAEDGMPLPAPLVDEAVRLSGGTPAILMGLLQACHDHGGLDGMPTPAMRSMLLQRLNSCSSTAEGVARLASVAGASFSVRMASDITGLSSWRVAEKWNELLLAGVFDAKGFAVPLLETVVYESVPETVRQFMHGEVAAVLERHGATAGELAHHWRMASDMTRAAAYERKLAGQPGSVPETPGPGDGSTLG
ncbi:DNA-binding transcriptional activator of the SARP family [Roseateles sp. YR242]|uniref:AAA family ATPase n=1 Tax=Roseateles sp. YR242 TaxID=1855305 RepID=UPI0008ADD5AB|nr:AAA family ATPase [Roseateles sp. YR242]SEL82928.1 DNA-binding transcriptional activator of the SARP family [Roseateles sp. YR242]